MELVKFFILATLSVITYGRDFGLSDSGDDDLATSQSQYLSQWSVPPYYGSYYSPALGGNFKTNIQSQLQNQQQSAGDVRKYYGVHNGIGGFSTVEGIGATSSSQSQSQSQTQIEHSGTLGDNLSNLGSSQVQAQLQRYGSGVSGGSSDQIQGQLQGYGSSQQLQSQLQGYNGGSADQLQAQYQGYDANLLQGYGGVADQIQGQYQGYGNSQLQSQLQAVDGGLEQQLQGQYQGYNGGNLQQLQGQYQGYNGGNLQQLQGQYQGYNGGISGIGGSSQQLQSQLQRYGYGGNAEQLQTQLQGYGDGSVDQVQAQLQGLGDNTQIQGQLEDYRNSQLQAQLQGLNGGSQAQLQSQLQGLNGGSSEQLQGQYQGITGGNLDQLQGQYQGGIGGIVGSSQQLQEQLQGNSRQLAANEYNADILKGASLLKTHPQISGISSLGGGRTVHLLDGYTSIPTTRELPVSLGWDTSGKSSLIKDYGSYGLGINRDLGRNYRRYNSIYPRIIQISRPSTVGYTSVNPVLGNNYRYSNVISSGSTGLSNPLLLEKDYRRYNVIRPYLRPYLSYRRIYPLTYSSGVQASSLGGYSGYKQYNIKPSLTKLYGSGGGVTSIGTEYQTPILEKYNDLAAYNLNRDYKHYKIVRPSIIRILKTSGTGGYNDFSLGGGYGGYTTLYQPWSKSLQGQLQSGSTVYPSSNYQAQYQAGSLASSAIPVLRSNGYGEAKSLQSQYQGASSILPSSSSYQGQYQASSLLSPSVQAQMQSSGWETSPISYQAQVQASSISKREAPTDKALYSTEKPEIVAKVDEN